MQKLSLVLIQGEFIIALVAEGEAGGVATWFVARSQVPQVALHWLYPVLARGAGHSRGLVVVAADQFSPRALATVLHRAAAIVILIYQYVERRRR